MSIDLSQINLNIFGWIGLLIVLGVIAIVVVHFFFHHLLPFVIKGCSVILVILALLALLHYVFHLF